MLQRMLIAMIMMAATVSTSTAGTIAKGAWSPTACGSKPMVPIVDQASVDAYNKSVKAINEWQQKANAYNTCMINEANADNALISRTANDEQNQLRVVRDKLQIDTDAAKAKLDAKLTPGG
ncbi:MAG: hypothetical protein NTV43_15890 [Methylococcales bacterium]|nr:hypothetical protein [Methylococcales bacterium]